MKTKVLFRLFKVLYQRNLVKNMLMVSFMLITNLVLGFFIVFLQSESLIIPSLSTSYFEHLSVDVQSYERISSNNELIAIKKYKRPDINYLHNLMEHSGRFKIRPDYKEILSLSTLKLYEKELPRPLFIVVDNIKSGFGINNTYLDLIKNDITIEDNEFLLSLNLTFNITYEEEDITFVIEDELPIDFIFKEPKYFASPKIFIPQEYIDKTIGALPVKEGLSINNYLLNLSEDHALTNYKYRLHFDSVTQKEHVSSLLNAGNTKEQGVELSSDANNKVNSFKALYDYLNILVMVFFIFIIIASLIMHIIVAHTSLLALQKQLALLQIIGGSKSDLLLLFLALNLFNFMIGLLSLFILPLMMPVVSYFLYIYLNVAITIYINVKTIILLILINLVILITLIISLFLFNTRRPLLYLLIDA